MTILKRIAAATILLLIFGTGWLALRMVVELFFGTWSGGVPHPNTTTWIVLSLFSAIYLALVIFTIRRVDRLVRG
ncbi:hypothetical protein [Altererythrobacter sp. MF3-039]|uniref:hypothetical protein n=1 Tax=Altererythrobacter sp. MF3-039 TaxID=3252901 RepID=UPI00390CA915